MLGQNSRVGSSYEKEKKSYIFRNKFLDFTETLLSTLNSLKFRLTNA
jgi:hypothetical protein